MLEHWMINQRTYISIVVSLVLLLGANNLRAQDSLWADSYGGSFNESGYAVTQLENGDLFLLGSTFSYGSGDHDIFLIKTDSGGNMLWNQTYGGSGTEYGHDIDRTSDGKLIITGSTTSSGEGQHDLLLLKVDLSGNLEWSKTYGGSEDDEGWSVREINDSGFIICGTTSSYGTGTDIYLLRTDSVGDTLWSKTYGGSGGETGYCVRETNDNGFIMIGNTGSYGTGYCSVYLVRTNSAGDTLWTSTYGGDRADFGYSVELTNDEGFIIAGATALPGASYYDAYMVKVDSFGVVEWDEAYGGTYEERAFSAHQTDDGGYILAGTTESNNGRKVDMYLIKADAGGNLEWESSYGGPESDICRKLLITPERDYLLLGHTFSYSSGGSDVYLVKVRGVGMTPVDWNDPILPGDIYELKQNFPNPFNLATSIRFYLPRASSCNLTIFNLLGQTVKNWSMDYAVAGWNQLEWDGRDSHGRVVASGIYFYRLQTTDGFNRTRKMVLIK